METKQTKQKDMEFTEKMSDFLVIFKRNNGRVQDSVDKFKLIKRAGFYWWYNHCPEFKRRVKEANESFKDMVEGKIAKHIKSKDSRISADMCKFYAKTKMKDRGYVERTELNQNIKSDNKIQVEIIEVQKSEDESPEDSSSV